MELSENIDGMSIYLNHIMLLADEWLEVRKIVEFKHSQFPDLLYYICDHTEKITTDEIDKLNMVFDCYVRLCGRFEVVPSIYGFSLMIGISRDTFQSWGDSTRRAKSPEYVRSYKNWLKICESVLATKIENSSSAPIGAIFSAKCNYKWRETTPIQAEVLESQEKVSLEDSRKEFETFQIEGN